MSTTPAPGPLAERGFVLRTQSSLPLGHGGRPEPRRPAYLIVFEGDVSYRFDLPQSGSVIIGRAPDAALRLDQSSASRHHARLDVQSDGVWLSDMESRNGTRLNGQLLRGANRLSHGDAISVCNATLIVQQQTSGSELRPFVSTAQLRLRLEEEIDRTVRHRRPFVLLSLCFHIGADESMPSRTAVADALGGVLRVMDVPAWQADDSLLLLCLELRPDGGEALANRILTALRPLAPKVRVRCVACPRDGTDPDLLINACADSPFATGPVAGTVQSDTDVQTLKIGELRVLVVEPTMKRLYALLERLAAAEIPLMIQGETGTGKEVAAAAVHHFSKRRERPLVAVNCAAIPESLVESELFGHERGAFSGAVTSKAGLFESAQGGTLFLDEIGELSLAIQAKLLRAVETKRIVRVGDSRERSIDVRLLAATHRDLQVEVAAGRFRQDLYFRLAVGRVYLPPLRDRRREIAFLAQSFLAAACLRCERPLIEIVATTQHLLTNYGWPGNIRQLKNVMEYAAAAIEEDVLLPYHVQPQLEQTTDATNHGPAAAAPEPPPIPPVEPRVFRPIDEEIRELERQRMLEALEACGGVHVRAAALISMPIRTFTGKLKTHLITTHPRAAAGTKQGL